MLFFYIALCMLVNAGINLGGDSPPDGFDQVQPLPEYDDTEVFTGDWVSQGRGLCSNNDGGHADLWVSTDIDNYNSVQKCQELCERQHKLGRKCFGVLVHHPYCAVYIWWGHDAPNQSELSNFIFESKATDNFSKSGAITKSIDNENHPDVECYSVQFRNTCEFNGSNGETIFSMMWFLSIGIKAELWPFWLGNVPGSNNEDCQRECCSKSACLAYEFRPAGDFVSESISYCRLYTESLEENNEFDLRAQADGVVLAFKELTEAAVSDTESWNFVGDGMCKSSDGSHPVALYLLAETTKANCMAACRDTNALQYQQCYGISISTGTETGGVCILHVRWASAHEGTRLGDTEFNWSNDKELDAVEPFDSYTIECHKYTFTTTAQDEVLAAAQSVADLACTWDTFADTKIFSPLWIMPWFQATYIGPNPEDWPFFLAGPFDNFGNPQYCRNLCCGRGECTAYETVDGKCTLFKEDLEEGSPLDQRAQEVGTVVYFVKSRTGGQEADVGELSSTTMTSSWMPTYTDGIAFVLGALFAGAVVAAYNSKKGSSLEAYLIPSEEV